MKDTVELLIYLLTYLLRSIVQLFHSLGAWSSAVISFTSQPFYPKRKNASASWIWGWVDHRTSLDLLKCRKNDLSLPGIEPRIAQLVTYSLYRWHYWKCLMLGHGWPVRCTAILWLQHRLLGCQMYCRFVAAAPFAWLSDVLPFCGCSTVCLAVRCTTILWLQHHLLGCQMYCRFVAAAPFACLSDVQYCRFVAVAPFAWLSDVQYCRFMAAAPFAWYFLPFDRYWLAGHPARAEHVWKAFFHLTNFNCG